MTKAELIDGLAAKAGLNRSEAEHAINVIIDEVTTALKQGERVNISGFGTFAVSIRRPRSGRNPKTGESIQIAGGRSAKFRAGKQLKDSLNQGVEAAPTAAPVS
jgi:DNA-binding protein HU-beta